MCIIKGIGGGQFAKKAPCTKFSDFIHQMDCRAEIDFVFAFSFLIFGNDFYIHTFKINAKHYALAALDCCSISKLVCLVERLGKQVLNKVLCFNQLATKHHIAARSCPSHPTPWSLPGCGREKSDKTCGLR